MNAAAADDRLAFAPPKQPGLLRGFALAVLAHGLLVAALMHGLQWKRDAQEAAVEAELWSALPQQAAPREAPPPPPPPQPVVKAPPEPVVKAPPQPDPQVQRDAQIALERERELEKRELEKRKLVEQRAKLEAQKKKQREEELAKKKLEQQKLLAEARRKEDETKRKQQEQEARDAKKLAAIREENMKRMQGMASKGSESSSTAAQSSGPSQGWAARVIGRVRPNIVFTEVVTANLEAVVEVRLAPDGTIVGKRLKKASGNRNWDEAVLRALDKTEVLPRDPETGRVPSGADLVFRPRG